MILVLPFATDFGSVDCRPLTLNQLTAAYASQIRLNVSTTVRAIATDKENASVPKIGFNTATARVYLGCTPVIKATFSNLRQEHQKKLKLLQRMNSRQNLNLYIL